MAGKVKLPVNISLHRMRIFSQDLDRTFDEITLILSHSEMEELRDMASALADNADLGHCHVLCEDFSQATQKQITITALDSHKVLGGFAPRILKVIETDS